MEIGLWFQGHTYNYPLLHFLPFLLLSLPASIPLFIHSPIHPPIHSSIHLWKHWRWETPPITFPENCCVRSASQDCSFLCPWLCRAESLYVSGTHPTILPCTKKDGQTGSRWVAWPLLQSDIPGLPLMARLSSLTAHCPCDINRAAWIWGEAEEVLKNSVSPKFSLVSKDMNTMHYICLHLYQSDCPVCLPHPWNTEYYLLQYSNTELPNLGWLSAPFSEKNNSNHLMVT